MSYAGVTDLPSGVKVLGAWEAARHWSSVPRSFPSPQAMRARSISQCRGLVSRRALRGVQQLRQVLLPDGGPGVGTMAMRFIRSGQQYEAPVLDAFDFTLGDA